MLGDRVEAVTTEPYQIGNVEGASWNAKLTLWVCFNAGFHLVWQGGAELIFLLFWVCR